jgi:NADH:ubiquinone oxidoreductase subunit E
MSGGANTPLGELPGNPHAGEHGARSCGHSVEFSAPGKETFDRLLSRYPTKQAALLPALWLAQKEFGWISREAVDYLATLLTLSPAFVWGVVTFYTMFNRAPWASTDPFS